MTRTTDTSSVLETPEQRLARYQSTLLGPDWPTARGAVIAAVLAVGPRDAEDAKCLASRLCGFLQHARWNRSQAPDLQVLLTNTAIEERFRAVQAAGATSRGSAVQRSDLRRIAAALASQPGPRAEAAASSRNRRPAPGAVSPSAGTLQELLAPAVALNVVAVAYEQRTGRSLRPDVLNEVIKLAAVPSASAITRSGTEQATGAGSAVLHLDALSGQSTQGVSPRTCEPTSADTTSTSRGGRPRKPATTAKPRPLSRRAVLRGAATAIAAQADTSPPELIPAGELTGEIAAAVDAFRPVGPAARTWPVTQDWCRALARAYSPETANAARSACTHIAGLLNWMVSSPHAPGGAGLNLARLLTVGLCEAYDTHLASSGAPDGTRATVRSVLRRAIYRATPVEQRPAKIAYQPVAAPYTAAECAALARLARNQPSDVLIREMCAIVGLGLGAGLDARDLRTLAPEQISECSTSSGEPLLLVTVLGERARVVPVRSRYEPLVRRALELHQKAGRGRRAPLVGVKVDRRNVGSTVTGRAVTATGTGVDIDLRRLRNTWLVEVMCAPVPLSVLLGAAGLRSARTLCDLLPHCPTADPEQVRELLAAVPDQPDGAS